MAYREHGMWEILDVLKRHHRGESQRRIAAATGRGRKTIRAYIREAKKLGWSKEVPPDEALASRVAQRRQPGPSSSEASASEKALRGHHDRIQQWVEGCEGERGLKLTKVHELLTREGSRRFLQLGVSLRGGALRMGSAQADAAPGGGFTG